MRGGVDREHARDRPTARVIVVDPADRILLMEGTTAWAPGVWFTPGGGAKPGETLAHAATRELWEETGWVAATMGPRVWQRSHVWQEPGGCWFRSLEHFFWLRTPAFEARFTQMDAQETRSVGRMRWWTAEELVSGEHTFAPRRLPALLAALLGGEFPSKPLDVGL